MVYGAMLAKSCVRSHGHPVPGVRSAAIISISRWISRAGVMPGSGRRGGSSPAGSSPASMASPGLDELRWHKPVRPGDELRIRVRVLAAERSRSKPDRGMVHTGIEVLNQHCLSAPARTAGGCEESDARRFCGYEPATSPRQAEATGGGRWKGRT